MNKILEQSISKQLFYVSKEIERKNLTLSELLSLHSVIEILILKHPEHLTRLQSKLSQIERRMSKRRSIASPAERSIARYQQIKRS